MVETFTGYYVFALGVSRFMALAYWIIQVRTVFTCSSLLHLLSDLFIIRMLSWVLHKPYIIRIKEIFFNIESIILCRPELSKQLPPSAITDRSFNELIQPNLLIWVLLDPSHISELNGLSQILFNSI